MSLTTANADPHALVKTFRRRPPLRGRYRYAPSPCRAPLTRIRAPAPLHSDLATDPQSPLNLPASPPPEVIVPIAPSSYRSLRFLTSKSPRSDFGRSYSYFTTVASPLTLSSRASRTIHRHKLSEAEVGRMTERNRALHRIAKNQSKCPG